MSGIRTNILVKWVLRNGGVMDAKEYFGQVDTKKWRNQGSARIFWSSRYLEMQVSWVRKNIMVELIGRNGGIEGEQEYYGQVDR